MVLQIGQIFLDMATDSQGISVRIDWLVCNMPCACITCTPCFTKKQFLRICYDIRYLLSPAKLFDGGEALCYLDCCSICIATIIICMYLGCNQLYLCDSHFPPPPLSCDLTCSTRKAAPILQSGEIMCLFC